MSKKQSHTFINKVFRALLALAQVFSALGVTIVTIVVPPNIPTANAAPIAAPIAASPASSLAAVANAPQACAIPNSIGGLVYRDNNKNGIYEAGIDTLVNGATIDVVHGHNYQTVGTVTTAAPLTGTWSITLPTSVVTATEPLRVIVTNLTDGPPGPDNATRVSRAFPGDCDINISVSPLVTPAHGIVIGNFVWHDWDGSGTFTPDEPPITGVTLSLYNVPTDTLLMTTTTDARGYYAFHNGLLVSGTLIARSRPYQVRIDSSNYDVGGALQGLTRTAPARTGANINSDGVTLPNGQVGISFTIANTTTTSVFYDAYDFGFHAPITTTPSLVYYDLDGDGRYEPADGETPVSGVTVNYVVGTNILATYTTGVDGIYSFTNVPLDTYIARITTTHFITGGLLEGYQTTLGYGQRAGEGLRLRAGNWSSAGQFAAWSVYRTDWGYQDVYDQYVLESNQALDFAFTRAGVSGYIWHDLDRDGVMDFDEPFLNNIEVHLLDSSLNMITNTFSDASGLYRFRNYPAGTYTVRVVAPGYTFSPADQGTDDSADSEVNASGDTAAMALPSGNHRRFINAGLSVDSCNSNRVCGWVFHDYNQDGTRAALDNGVSGVTVTAYDATGAALSTTATDNGGAYTLTVANGTPIRIEFTNLPLDYQPGVAGANSGTTVLFATSPITNQNLGLIRPCQYCQNTPNLASSYHVNGDPLGGGTAGDAQSLVSFAYTSTAPYTSAVPNAWGFVAPTGLALSEQIGSSWGLAWQRSSNSLFAAALMRRHMGFGPLGPGGLYKVDLSTAGSPVVSNFADLNTYGLNLGSNPRDTTISNSLPITGSVPNYDVDAFNMVAKSSIGGIEVSEDDRTLWVMNLNQRVLHQIPIGRDGVMPLASAIETHAIANPGCSNNDYRPWAVRAYQGFIYIGVVCTGETSQLKSDLHAYVMRLDTANTGAGFAPVINFALNFRHGCGRPDGCIFDWYPWLTRDIVIASNQNIHTLYATGFYYPTPLLVDFEFDNDGSLVMGFADRTGYQTANNQYQPNIEDPQRTTNIGHGQMIRACNINGALVLENGGKCPGRPVSPGETRADNYLGPGGGSYYWDDSRASTSEGALAFVPGRGEIVSNFSEPFAATGVHGYPASAGYGPVWMSNFSGYSMRRYEIANRDYITAGVFYKGQGLGDLEPLCDPAPMEIGNRVWWDSNRNGVQDPGENGIDGVTLELWLIEDGTTFADGQALPSGAVKVAETTTANGGQYFFSYEGDPSKDNANGLANQNWLNVATSSSLLGFDKVVVSNTLQTTGAVTRTGTVTHHRVYPNMVYQVRVGDALQNGSANYTAINAADPSTNGVYLTTRSNGGAGSAYLRDSNAFTNTNNADVYVATGNAGESNHTFDIGFGFPNEVQFGDRVWIESDNDGNVGTGTITPVAGMVITASNGISTFTATTDASGYYSFSVPAGTYTVTYGPVPGAYGAVVASSTPLGGSASGNAGSYAGGGDQSRPQNSTITLAAGEANWTMDFA
ncbi:MAG: hypothetical protein KIH69_006660, partial [Anaerolineae bacterium]|nr:hypothetical protein [Anaerolineae bacterium]